jgi:hypothetical protein
MADVLSIDTPAGLHAGEIIPALQQGKNIKVRSPLCLTTAAAWQIAETAKFTRRTVSVQRKVMRFGEARIDPEWIRTLNITIQAEGGSRFPEGGLLYFYPAALEFLDSLFPDLTVLESQIVPLGDKVEEKGSCVLAAGKETIQLKWTKGEQHNFQVLGKEGEELLPSQNETSETEMELLQAIGVVNLLEKIYKMAGVTF